MLRISVRERESMLHLIDAHERLGGRPAVITSVCGMYTGRA